MCQQFALKWQNLKDHLFRVVLPKVDEEDKSEPWGGKECFCELCKSRNDIFCFKRSDTVETFNILKETLGCDSNHVIYLPECKQCYINIAFLMQGALKVNLDTE